jgi:hypothetical protein
MGTGEKLEIQSFELLHDEFGARAPRISAFVASFAHVKCTPSESNI